MSNDYSYKKLPLVKSPKGVLVWPQIQESTINYKFNKKEGSYNCNLRVSKDQARELAQKIVKLRDQYQVDMEAELGIELVHAKLPFKKELDEKDNETDNILFSGSAKTKGWNPKTRKEWDTPVPIFNVYGKPFTDECKIGSGSEAYITFRLKPWHMTDDSTEVTKVGVRLVIEGVQILDLVKWTGSDVDAADLGFSAEADEPEGHKSLDEELGAVDF
jgi:hypothetical protein